MDTVVSRLDIFIKAKGLSYRAFELSIEASNSSISKAVKNNSSIGSDVLQKIFYSYPELNFIWLFSGGGEMLVGKKVTAALSIAAEPKEMYTIHERLEQLMQEVMNIKKHLKLKI